MLNTSNPFISIVTLNWNQTDITCEFLESTRNFSYKNYEILVCDMASVVDPTERIAGRNYPNTKVLRSEKNLGSTGGNNWGIRHANVFTGRTSAEGTLQHPNIRLYKSFSHLQHNFLVKPIGIN